MAVLDTNALIDLTRRRASPNRQSLESLLQGLILGGETICTTRINEAEFRVGGYRADDPEKEMEKIDDVLSTLVILEFDAAAAKIFAATQAKLLAIGKPAGGQADLMIAAVALANRQALVTRNVRHFKTVPGLTLLPY